MARSLCTRANSPSTRAGPYALRLRRAAASASDPTAPLRLVFILFIRARRPPAHLRPPHRPPRAPAHAPCALPLPHHPSSAYLRAPTNGYAHSGAPKRFVYLVGPSLDVALDARGAGGKERWVRSGCWPNAEVRAYVCKGASAGAGNASAASGSANGHAIGNGKGRGKMRDDDRADDAEARTHLGIFATRALKQAEEIVVGWEWDDANAVHRVDEVAGLDGLPIPPTPTQRHLIAQLANILHALGETGVGCACAPSTATATPAAPAHVPLTAKEKERRVTPGIESRPTVVSADKEEVDSGDGEQEHERSCVIRTMERVVFPPVPVERVQPRYRVHPGEEMDVDIDIEGEAAPRVRVSSAASLHP
ncbi:hypothetical protein B0H17DRAFT_511418 [Mycena rosella]|uniref:Uncharacterized protein n=1 Tax=Mycena rosella TaxID=1033263 RepID=A0AAD7FQQ3_MYCRO|nr:hypothetical protein B0H17DRAFT_511418 [Mycena rosella]